MNNKILSAVIAAAMIISMTALSGCDANTTSSDSAEYALTETDSVVFELDSEEASSDELSDTEKSGTDSEKKDAVSSKGDTESKKTENKKSSSTKSASSKSASSKSASSKAASSKSTSSKSESSKASSDGLTDDEALKIVLDNTDYTEDELTSNDPITESGESFHALSFYRNGTYVFYVRDSDGKFFTSEDFNSEYYGDTSRGIDEKKALTIVLQNTDYTEDELTSNDPITESGESFYALSFYRNGTYVFYVRARDGKFFTSEEFNSKYYGDTSLGIDEKAALAIVLQNTDYTEDELTSNTAITEDGDSFHALSFYRNGTYVFYVRDRDGAFFTSDDFNKAYNEDYDGYIGHD